MIDLRPVANVIGWMLIVLGTLMLVPAGVDWLFEDRDWRVFVLAFLMTSTTGALCVLATGNANAKSLTLRQSFLLTAATWLVLPAFGALPIAGALPGLTWTDALFEAMSGLTTTGTTVLVGLDFMPPGLLLWRSMLQWLGGLGIIIVALIFLPVMRIGGMQHFRSESFDTMGKVLPRAGDISWMLLQIYVALTILCAFLFMFSGMTSFDAINHAMTTLSTGGFSTRDLSFVNYSVSAHWIATVFMFLAGLPFIRYIQLVNGQLRPLYQDIQIRAYFRWTLYAVGITAAYRMALHSDHPEVIVREAFFNVVSTFSGTGFASADMSSWGDFVILVLIVVGFIGACTASTGCSIKVFRFLVLFEAIKGQLRQMIHPNRVVLLQLDGRRLDDEVVSSVVVLFAAFLLSFGTLAVGLSLTGLELRTAFTAAWTAICNIGPAFGAGVGPTGAVDQFPDAAKWMMTVAMFLGRLEIVAILVILAPRFWRG